MEANQHTCISCDTSFSGDFCNNCGERAIPKPINFKTFFNDVLGETLSFETPFLFTLKSVLKGPGKVPRKFIAGNRKLYAKPLGFFVLMTGINYLLATWIIDPTEMLQITKEYMAEMFKSIPTANQEGMDELINATQSGPLSQDKIRQLYFMMLPFLAFFSWLFFRKSKYNFMENIVAMLYIQGGTFVFAILNVLLGLFSLKASFHFATITNLGTMFYLVWGIYQFHDIKTAGSVFKALFVYVLAMLFSGLLFYWMNPFVD